MISQKSLASTAIEKRKCTVRVGVDGEESQCESWDPGVSSGVIAVPERTGAAGSVKRFRIEWR